MKRDYDIEGMHCRSCELLVEEKISKIPGVKKVQANSTKGKLFVESDEEISDSLLNKKISGTDYRITEKKSMILKLALIIKIFLLPC